MDEETQHPHIMTDDDKEKRKMPAEDGKKSETDKKAGHKNEKPKAKGVKQRSKSSIKDTVRHLRDADRGGGDKAKRRKYKAAYVLLLTFSFHDLGGELDRETSVVGSTFRGWGYGVWDYSIPMKDSSSKLQKTLDEFLKLGAEDTLLIVYYHGHGGINEDDKFSFTSHNYPRKPDILLEAVFDLLDCLDKVADEIEVRNKYKEFQKIAEVTWEDLRQRILNAGCDTALILDCCHAGLASIAEIPDKQYGIKEEKQRFTKELIGACAWSNYTAGRMSPTMCDVLIENSTFSDPTMTLTTLVRQMNNLLAEDFYNGREVPQAVHYPIWRGGPRIVLPYLRNPSPEWRKLD